MEHKNKESVALKAGVWYIISSIVIKAISIITTPLFTRILSTEEYGIVATFTSWYAMLSAVWSLNLSYSIGRAKLDFKGKLDEYISSMQLLAAAISIVLSLIVILFIHPIERLMELDSKIIVLLLIYLFFSPSVTFMQNSYRYQYQYKQNIAVAGYVGVSTILLSLVLIYVVGDNRAVLRIIGIVAPTILLSVMYWIVAFKNKRVHINKEYWKYGISISAPLVLHTISINILSQSDRVFIQKNCGASDTGIYSLVYSYSLLITIVTSAISDSWLPWFHDSYFENKFDEIRKSVKWIVVLGCYIGMACIALAPEAIAILGGNAYKDGIKCVPPIVLGVICQYIYTHYVNIELHLKQTKYVSGGTIFAAILNIVLNFIFIPHYGYVAAAYTTLISYIALMAVHCFITKKVFKVHLYDDVFMFGSMLVCMAAASIIAFSYRYLLLRYFLIIIGFVSFLVTFRKYLVVYACRIFRGKWKT